MDFFSSVYRVILGVGALAVAVGAVFVLVKQLTPNPPPVRTASFEDIEVARDMTLAEYEADRGIRANAAFRTLPPEHAPPAAYRLVADIVPANSYRTKGAVVQEGNGTPAGEVSEVLANRSIRYRAPRSRPSQGTTTSASTTTEATPSANMTTSATPSATPSASTTTSIAGATEATEAPEAIPPPPPPYATPSHTFALPSKCVRCPMLLVIERALADARGDSVAAAGELHAAEGEWRKRYRNGKPQLVGVAVNYTLDLQGFAGQVVKVEYTIVSVGRHLSEDWWGRHMVITLTKPIHDKALIPERFWALIPQTPGTYYFHLELLNSSGEEVGYKDTPQFH